jgi:hypothetical protein
MTYLITVCAAIFVAAQIVGIVLYVFGTMLLSDKRWGGPVFAGIVFHNTALTLSLYLLLIANVEGAYSANPAAGIGLGFSLYVTMMFAGVFDSVLDAEKGTALKTLIGHVDLPTLPVRKMIARIKAKRAEALAGGSD